MAGRMCTVVASDKTKEICLTVECNIVYSMRLTFHAMRLAFADILLMRTRTFVCLLTGNSDLAFTQGEMTADTWTVVSCVRM